MTITVGTNSYITAAEADTYFADTQNSGSWSALTAAAKSSSLLDATVLIDQQSFISRPDDDDQALEWPRIGVVNRRGLLFDVGEVPQDVKDCQAELALHLALNLPAAGASLPNISNVSHGSLSWTLTSATSYDTFHTIRRWLWPYLAVPQLAAI